MRVSIYIVAKKNTQLGLLRDDIGPHLLMDFFIAAGAKGNTGKVGALLAGGTEGRNQQEWK